MGLLNDLFGGGGGSQLPGFQSQGMAQNIRAGSGLAGQQLGQITQGAFPLAQQLTGAGQGFIDQAGAAGNQITPFLGMGPVQEQIGALGQQLNQNLTQNLLPAIQSQGVATRGLGGSRQGVAQGLASQGTQQAFGLGTANILGNAFNQQGQLAAQQGQIQNQGAAIGLGGLQNVMQSFLSPFQAQFQPLLNQSQVLGNPILQQGEQGANVIGGLAGLGTSAANLGARFG